MGLILFVSIAVIVAAIRINKYVAEQFEAVANAKGHYGKHFFHLCFWLGVVGYLLVIALPDRGKSIVASDSAAYNANDKLPEL